jgi:hypothetical protein
MTDPLTTDEQVPQPAAAGLATGGADQPAPVPSVPRCRKHNVTLDVETECHICHGEGVIEDLDDVIGRGSERCYACGGSGIGWPDCEFCIEESHDEL